MIAIWPVGPPKLMKPSLSQKRNASAKETGAGGAESMRCAGASKVRSFSNLQSLDAPASWVRGSLRSRVS
jgi:hypothetical protein